MVTDIRTPDDEVDKPGYFYPPFREGWWYQGQTYSGHSDFAVDWNRRTKTGGWLDDRGDPVLAAADGVVAETIPVDGYVAIDHWGGTYRTEYRHMQPVTVKVGDKVKRGDLVGRIGEAGNAPNGTHLHHRQYRQDAALGWKPIKQRFYGQPVEVSVSDSDTRPAGWKPPTPVMVQGPPTRATWESAFKEASVALGRAQADITAFQSQVDQLEADLATALSRIEILESATQPDLTEVRKSARQSFKDEVLALPA